jgi:hypothetical protein
MSFFWWALESVCCRDPGSDPGRRRRGTALRKQQERGGRRDEEQRLPPKIWESQVCRVPSRSIVFSDGGVLQDEGQRRDPSEHGRLAKRPQHEVEATRFGPSSERHPPKKNQRKRVSTLGGHAKSEYFAASF